MRIDPHPTIPEVLPAARAYLAEHPGGGHLPILTAGRITDERVIGCAEEASDAGDGAGLRLARLLLRLSRAQRYRLRRMVA